MHKRGSLECTNRPRLVTQMPPATPERKRKLATETHIKNGTKGDVAMHSTKHAHIEYYQRGAASPTKSTVRETHFHETHSSAPPNSNQQGTAIRLHREEIDVASGLLQMPMVREIIILSVREHHTLAFCSDLRVFGITSDQLARPT